MTTISRLFRLQMDLDPFTMVGYGKQGFYTLNEASQACPLFPFKWDMECQYESLHTKGGGLGL